MFLFFVVGGRAQASKLQHQCHEHYAAENGKSRSEVAAIGPASEHVCHSSTCEHAHHIHHAVGCGAILGRYNLAEYRHVVGIEHAVAHTEEQSGTHHSGEAMSHAKQYEGRNCHSQTNGAGVYSAAYVA